MKFKDTHYGDLTGKDFSFITIKKTPLTSLEGCPKSLGSMELYGNNLSSLKHCPKIVYNKFSCVNNDLEDLQYFPKEVGKSINIYSNKLKTLKGAPKVIVDDFNCSFNNLNNFVGLPNKMGGSLYINTNNLISLKGCPTEINGILDIRFNAIVNPLDEIIKYGIKAIEYQTDEGDFTFEQIEKEFNEYQKKIQKIKLSKNNIKTYDYGLGI